MLILRLLIQFIKKIKFQSFIVFGKKIAMKRHALKKHQLPYLTNPNVNNNDNTYSNPNHNQVKIYINI